MKLFPSLLAFLSICSPVLANEIILPSRHLSPREVIEIQLTALQTNSAKKPNAGIQQTWAFAHPNNRAVTGPIERFAKMLKNKNYRSLLGHKEYKIRKVVIAPKIANFHIVIVSSDNLKLSFDWRLQKVEEGDFIGSWMTTSVSPPKRAADAI